jgi:hypothetical protein
LAYIFRYIRPIFDVFLHSGYTKAVGIRIIGEPGKRTGDG